MAVTASSAIDTGGGSVLNYSYTPQYDNPSTIFDFYPNSTEEPFNSCDVRNPMFNCSLEEFLVRSMGPQRLPLMTAIPITVVYVLIFVTGFVGNVAVCVVIVRHPAMHTATNYYLFSLAVSDLTLLMLGLPNDISVYWHQYPFSLGIGFCKLRALLSEAASNVSVLTIVAFSTERYLAICHPLHLYAMSGLQRAVRIIAALWVVSLVCATPFFWWTTIHFLKYPPTTEEISESAFCAMLLQSFSWPLYELSFLLFFLLPAAVILVLYARMGLRIRARSRHSLGKGVKGSVHGEARQAQSRRAIIRMLAAVVIAFFACWAPFHAQRLIYVYGSEWEYYQEINEWMFSVTGWLYYVSCTVNPILYNVMSNRYRVAFRETLCCGRPSRANGLSREQSSFRETTIAASGEGSHLVRVRSMSCEPIHRPGLTGAATRHREFNNTVRWNHDVSRPWNNNQIKENCEDVHSMSNNVMERPQRSNSMERAQRNSSVMDRPQFGNSFIDRSKASMLEKPQAKPNSVLKSIFYSFNSDSTQNNKCGKNKELKFEENTENLIYSDDRDDEYEMEKLNTNHCDSLSSNEDVKKIPDSRSDPAIVTTNNLHFNSQRNDSPALMSTFGKTVNFDAKTDSKLRDFDLSVDQKSGLRQDVVVVLGRGPSNGLRKFYPNSGLGKNFGFASSVVKCQDDTTCDEMTKLTCEVVDSSETCI